jgi:predicted transcriptional regulator
MTLDDDVAEALRNLAHERHQPFKQVVNETLRQGLAPNRATEGSFKQTTYDMGLSPGVDMTKLNQLGDALEDEEILRKLEQGR